MSKSMTLAIGVWLCLFSTAGAQSNTITIRDRSGAAQANRPVSVARPFRQGEIPRFAQAVVNGTAVLTQCDVKNRWPDGSLKFAIVSFVVPNVAAHGTVTVAFGNQTTGNNTGFLTPADMLASSYNFDGTIEMTGATTQAVSARAMLQGGHLRYWLQGPIVTAILLEDRSTARTFDKDFGDGSKALHPIFEAWFYPTTGKVDLGFTVENTWVSNTASKSMRNLTYSLRLSSGSTTPTTEFSHAAFAHIGASRWHKRFWLGADPAPLTIDHNKRYLVATKAIPNYDTGFTVAESLIASHDNSWRNVDKTLDGNASGIGNYEKALDAAGANDWIGLMPTWDTMYLLTMDQRMLEKSLGNADLAGRLPWHFREADTLAGTGDYFDRPTTGSADTFGRVVSINARRTVTLSDLSFVCSSSQWLPDKINTGTVSKDGWVTTRDHMPDVAYIPYLMTGRYYYLEELQYQAAFIIGYKVGCSEQTYNRQAEAGYLHDSQVRGDAWGVRTLAYAAFLSPDGSGEKAYFEDKLKNNIAEWEGARDITLSDPAKQVHWHWGNANQQDADGPSPLGVWSNRGTVFIQSPLRQDGYLAGAASPWEENFLLCALGMARDFGYNTGNLMQFMAKTRFHNLLDPTSRKYLIEQYRIPSKLAATDNWIQDWPTYTSAYSTVPTVWGNDSTADHGYGFIALAGVSFLYPYTIDGYTGQSAWNLFYGEKPGKARFATESPKWAILPRTSTTGGGTPLHPPTNLTVR